MKTKIEYFLDFSRWSEVSKEIHAEHNYGRGRVWRQTKFHDGYTITCYFSNGSTKHRLDGPARIVTKNMKFMPIEFEKDWYVDGKCLPRFNNYYHSLKELFRYVKDYPELIKEVEMIARHNNWLTEDQLTLLTTLDMFNSG